jgi:predicted lipoprotein with Yx(FWY)xxD motif
MTHDTKTLSWKTARLLMAPAALALVIAGCGGGGSSSTPSTTAAKTAATSGPTLRLAKLEPGKALVDAQGRTLYLFEADKTDKSTCNGACASIWPPLTVKGAPRAGAGVLPGKLGITRRKDGALEVTYNRHPLYYYVGDTRLGDRKGQGLDQFGAEWYVLSPRGTTVG